MRPARFVSLLTHGQAPVSGLTRALSGALAASLLAVVAVGSVAQQRPPQARSADQPAPTRPVLRPGLQRPGVPANRPRRAPVDRAVMELLRKMIRPVVDYSGTQQTEVFGPNEQNSQQDIRGDAKGHVRITFHSPPGVAGDIMLISPGEFHNYHRRTNLDEMATWPTEWNEQEKRMLALIAQGVVAARKTGEEQIAGRTASIIELSLERPASGAAGIVQRKFWVDPETGIQLRIEKYNMRGILISRTTMLSLTTGPAAEVLPRDFEPAAALPGARPQPLFPGSAAPYRTVAEAMGRLPFRPLEAATIPAGFHMDGVWIFNGEAKRPGAATILMRYTDGVSNFSLYQRVAPEKAPETPGPRSFGRNRQRWLRAGADGTMLIQYIGHLSADQVQSVYDSLH